MKIKRYLLFSITTLISSFSVIAQVYIEQMEKHHYDVLKDFEIKDKEAEAIVIHDKGVTFFERDSDDSGYNMIFERYTRIKILKESGIKYATFRIPRHVDGRSFEHLRNLKAFTYNVKDGKIVKTELKKDQIFVEKPNENRRVTIFTLPDVKEGSLIEFTYTIVSPFIGNIRDWEFQWEIPVIKSEYTARMIPFFEYQYVLQGSKELVKFNAYKTHTDRYYGKYKFQDMVYEFELNDIPAFTDESFITTKQDYIIKIDFQLIKYRTYSNIVIDYITSYKDINKNLLELNDFGKYIKNAEKKADEVLVNENLQQYNLEERMFHIVKFVKQNFLWNGWVYKVSDKTVNEFLKEKIGNSASMNLFLLGLLKNEGYTAYPVILSTRSHGKIKYQFPFQHFFNYVLVLVEHNGQEYLLDATSKHVPLNDIPLECINDKGLVVMKKEERFVKLEPTTKNSTIESSFILNWNSSNDSLSGQFAQKFSGYDAVTAKKYFNNNHDLIVKSITNKGVTVEGNIETLNFQLPEKDYILNYSGRSFIEVIDSNYFIKPFLNEPPSESPLKLNKRTYPVDMMYERKRKYSSVIQIPEGFKIEYLPKNINYDNDLILINYNAEEKDGFIHIDAEYHFKKAVYPVREYGKIRYYYYEIVKRFNDKIVLVPL